jgi:hypothetical protein
MAHRRMEVSLSDLTGSDRRKLEKLLGMGGGYVLNFSDRTFAEFFDEYRVTIDADHYHAAGRSKANRMRTFWARDGNHIVGRVIAGLIEYGLDEHCLPDEPKLVEDCRQIAQRLLSDQPVPEIDALTAAVDDRDFDVLAQHVRDAIEKN